MCCASSHVFGRNVAPAQRKAANHTPRTWLHCLDQSFTTSWYHVCRRSTSPGPPPCEQFLRTLPGTRALYGPWMPSRQRVYETRKLIHGTGCVGMRGSARVHHDVAPASICAKRNRKRLEHHHGGLAILQNCTNWYALSFSESYSSATHLATAVCENDNRMVVKQAERSTEFDHCALNIVLVSLYPGSIASPGALHSSPCGHRYSLQKCSLPWRMVSHGITPHHTATERT